MAKRQAERTLAEWLEEQHPNLPELPIVTRVVNQIAGYWTCDTIDQKGRLVTRYWAEDKEDARQFCDRGY